MRRKWVILALLVLLGAVAWLALGYEPKSYNLGQIHRAIKGLQSDHPEVNAIVEKGSSAISPPTSKFRPVRALVRWFEEATGNKGTIGWEEKTEYADPYTIRYPSGDVVVIVYWTFEYVEKMGKIGRVSKVEVFPDQSLGPQADRVESEIRKQFPGLRCTTVKDSP